MTREEFLGHVATIGMAYGGSVISWGRSRLHNENVGGHPNSFHIIFEAADMVFDTFSGMSSANTYARRQGLHYKKNGVKTMHYQILPPERFVASAERIEEHEG